MRDSPNDGFDHAIASFRYVAVPELENTKVLGLKERAPGLIVRCLVKMLTAVQLKHQSALQTREIHDVGTDRHLTPKAGVGEFPGSQPAP